MNIKEKFTKITEMDVSTQGWDKTFEALNKEGRLDQKIMGKVLQALCETVDEMEDDVKTIKEAKSLTTPTDILDSIEPKGKAGEKAEPVQSS